MVLLFAEPLDSGDQDVAATRLPGPAARCANAAARPASGRPAVRR